MAQSSMDRTERKVQEVDRVLEALLRRRMDPLKVLRQAVKQHDRKKRSVATSDRD